MDSRKNADKNLEEFLKPTNFFNVIKDVEKKRKHKDAAETGKTEINDSVNNARKRFVKNKKGKAESGKVGSENKNEPTWDIKGQIFTESELKQFIY